MGVNVTAERPVVQVEEVDKVFNAGAPNETVALKGINLSIAAGEFVSIIGPSGCGKSTLMRLVGDLIEPTRGRVTVNGKPAAQARRDQDYGVVFQAPVLFEWRSILMNVELPLELLRMSGREKEGRAREMLRLVELAGFENHYPWQLSGGMQQRAAIARALALKPPLLLMDEPFGALDEMTRERMNLELHRIWEELGMTIVFITHSIAEAVYLSNRVVVMSARPGQITRVVEIDLPQVRTPAVRDEVRFFELVVEVREALRAAEGAA